MHDMILFVAAVCLGVIAGILVGSVISWLADAIASIVWDIFE